MFIFFFTISWQIPKCLPHKKNEEAKEDGQITEEKKDDGSSADGKAPKLGLEIKVDGKEDAEDEFHPHIVVTWDPPRRLVYHRCR